MALQGPTFYDDHNNLLVSTRINASNNDLANTRIGIYGWRKRCIYCLILIIVIILFVNIALTVWILVSISFNYNGLIGNVKLTNNGIKINDQIAILDDLVVSKISNSLNNNEENEKKSHNLDIYSDKSIEFYTKNNVNNQLEKTLTMNNDELKLNCKNFTVVNNKNETLFSITDKYALLNTQELRHENNESILLKFESLEANNINSNDNLNVRTTNGTINISSNNLTLNGTNLILNSKNNLTINASKRITFQAEEIKLVRLPEFQPTTNINQKAVNNVMQLCLCKNGLLYAHSPTKPCSNDASICNED